MMSRRIHTLFLASFTLIVVSAYQATAAQQIRDVEIKPSFIEVLNADGAPVDVNNVSDTALYEAYQNNPIMTPDGRHLTLADFLDVRGKATADCLGDGTRVVLQLEGLLPNGVYTAWTDTFKAPGFTLDFANDIGWGALGPPDGSESVIIASENGEGTLETIIPAGALSIDGEIGACALDVYEFVVWGDYKIDGNIYGDVPGPDGVHVVHFAAHFKEAVGATPVEPQGKLTTTWGTIKKK